ncbi:MAG: bifunctional 4-hydroxy-2-oxoglutarate aldolase/2-dehydro-3-deoxy-phosphogluconate aldolase [Planctomycetota bacterium]
MDFSKTIEELRKLKVISVLRAPSADGAVKACEAMSAGGIKVMEITTTTTDWIDALKGVAVLDGVVLGVGTLVKPEQAEMAKNAGAVFAVSPGFDPDIADACLACELPFFPGIVTPSELMAAQKHAAVAALKLFPAGSFGGAKYMKALKGPFPAAEFIPTGGVSKDNAKEYLDAGAIAVGMSAICKGDVIKAQDWAKITADSKDVMESI